jgi:hypothetical protein
MLGSAPLQGIVNLESVGKLAILMSNLIQKNKSRNLTETEFMTKTKFMTECDLTQCANM